MGLFDNIRADNLGTIRRTRGQTDGVFFNFEWDLRAVFEDFEYLITEKTALRRAVRAANNTARLIQQEALKYMSGVTGISIRHLQWRHSESGRRSRRRRLTRRLARVREPAVEWWMTPLDITVASLGPMQELKGLGGGVIAADGRFYRGAFIQRPYGHPQALRRIGRETYPIEPVRRDISRAADSGMRIAINDTGRRAFRAEFVDQMRDELRRQRQGRRRGLFR